MKGLKNAVFLNLIEFHPLCINSSLISNKKHCNHTGTSLQHLVLPGIALGNNMCNCLEAVMSTQAITLRAHSEMNTSDCKERVGAQEMQVLASAITR